MAITHFIPEIWNAQMLENFHETAVAAGLVNRSYEGNATSGNTVNITGLIDVAVNDYATGAVSDGASGTLPRTTVASEVTDTTTQLLIDQEKAFDFYIDDIDRAQAAGSMDAYTRSAAVGLAEDADKFILTTAVTGAGTSLTNIAATGTTADTWFNAIRDLRKALNKAHVPMGSRVLVINAEFEAQLLAADAKLTQANVSGTPAGLRDATLGNLLGFRVVTSENLPVTAQPQALAFHQSAIAYVSQIEKTEALRAQDKFADRLRGLHVYGGKVVRPTAVVTVKQAAS